MNYISDLVYIVPTVGTFVKFLIKSFQKHRAKNKEKLISVLYLILSCNTRNCVYNQLLLK